MADFLLSRELVNMKYTIEGFSQSEAVKLKKAVDDGKGGTKTICLDCTDLVILRWFVDFFPSMTKIVVDGVQYAWIDYKYLLEDMPLLGIKKRMLALRLQKMAELGVLAHKTIKAGGTYSYYTLGENYMCLVRNCEDSKNIDDGVANKFTTHSQNIGEGVGNKLAYKDASTTDTSTKYESTIDTKKARKETRHEYGEYKNVLLSDAEYEKLVEEFPNDYNERIERVSSYCASTGKSYKNYLATIRNWARRDGKKPTKKQEPTKNMEDGYFHPKTLEDYKNIALNGWNMAAEKGE